jgi:hypothetical protein
MKSAMVSAKYHKIGIALAVALAMSLCALPLAACSGSSDSGSSKSQDQSQSGSTEATIVNPDWKTLGDALANQTGLLASGNNDSSYVIVFTADDGTYRAVAKMQPDTAKKLEGLDIFDPENTQKIIDAVSGLELISAEEISGDVLSQEEVDSYLGKTGQDLIDDGLTFDRYFMSGGDQTAASFSRGYHSYEFTFDTKIAEDDPEDGGAAIMSAKIVEAHNYGNLSNAVFDLPTE